MTTSDKKTRSVWKQWLYDNSALLLMVGAIIGGYVYFIDHTIGRYDKLDAKIDTKFKDLDTKIDSKFDNLNPEIEKINDRLYDLTGKFSRLEGLLTRSSLKDSISATAPIVVEKDTPKSGIRTLSITK